MFNCPWTGTFTRYQSTSVAVKISPLVVAPKGSKVACVEWSFGSLRPVFGVVVGLLIVTETDRLVPRSVTPL